MDERKYSFGEELTCAILSGISVLLMIAGLVIICVFSSSVIGLVSGLFYSIFCIVYFTMSTLFHSFKINSKVKKVFLILEEFFYCMFLSSIFIPICLVGIHSFKGVMILVLITLLLLLSKIFNIKYSNYSLSKFVYVLLYSAILLLVVNLISSKGLLLIMYYLVSMVTMLIDICSYRCKLLHILEHVFMIGCTLIGYFYVLFYFI